MEERKKNEILLETGTNELEIMEFLLDNRSFGINVAKVLEIMKYEEITPVPHSNPYIEGVFKPRDNIITVINLAKYLNLNESSDNERDILIITNFNKNNTAFHVHSVETIHRISWTDMEKPDDTIYRNVENVTTGIARIGEKLITILDFEKIMAELNPKQSIDVSTLGDVSKRPISHKPIYLVEDSIFLTELLIDCLHTAGYTNTTVFTNGLEAWEAIQTIRDEGRNPLDEIACIITDIEMPKMDGHMLSKLIKTDLDLQSLPVVIFSSLIDESMAKKGESLNVDAQISKPEIKKIIEFLDEFIA